MSDGYQIKDQHALYFLTFQIVFWVDIFTRADHRDVILESLSFCRQQKELELYAYVIMSNHVHLICKREHLPLSDFVRDFKKYTSYRILQEINKSEHHESRKNWLLDKFSYAARRNARNSNYQLWTHENHAVELTSNKMTEQRRDYIHENPVRAKLVEFPEEYLYSSARNYSGRKALIDIDLM
jgi:REP element-mobilizing transposase RayT